MTFHVIIPARLASSRLPEKPLADLAGLPMVVRVAHRAAASHATSVTVATDDMRVVQVCREHRVSAVLTRGDHLSGSDRLAEAVDLLGLPDDALVVNVQGDEPLIEPRLIADCARRLQDRSDCMVATIAHRIETDEDRLSPHVVKVVLDAQSRALYFSRAPIPAWRDRRPSEPLSDAPAPVLRHVGLYAYRAAFLRLFPTLTVSPIEQAEMLEQLRVLWHGHRIAVEICAQAPAAGVDTPEDLERVRRLLSG